MNKCFEIVTYGSGGYIFVTRLLKISSIINPYGDTYAIKVNCFAICDISDTGHQFVNLIDVWN